ncbi:hypothetical protein [Stackebrandtia soli]|uniref:hypothetical protein n=1 Tax=Stackebrandtia soli TaxID=1892856 RepID=UPI0039ED6478
MTVSTRPHRRSPAAPLTDDRAPYSRDRAAVCIVESRFRFPSTDVDERGFRRPSVDVDESGFGLSPLDVEESGFRLSPLDVEASAPIIDAERASLLLDRLRHAADSSPDRHAYGGSTTEPEPLGRILGTFLRF